MATFEGGIGECGDAAYPGIFVQIDEMNVFNFIKATMKSSGSDGK